MQKFIAEKNINLSELLKEGYKGRLGKMRLEKLYSKREIKVNGERVNSDCKLFQGDIVECYYEPPKKEIVVIYKDENILICNKPSGINSEDYYNEVKETFKNAIFTHRLDRNTRGLMVFALNDESYNELYRGFKERTIEKYYHCLVSGCFREKQGTLSDYIFKDAKKSIVKIYSEKKVGTLPVITKYQEVARGSESSVLKILLVTGRTHQIRAHLAYYGHFIIGDGKYGVEKVNNIFKIHTQMLMSSEIIFHFKNGEKLFYLSGKRFSISPDEIFKNLR